MRFNVHRTTTISYHLTSWKKPQNILDKCTFCITQRKNKASALANVYQITVLSWTQDELLDLKYHKEVSSTFTEQRMGAKLSQVSLWLQEHEHSLAQSIDFNVVACDLQDRVHVEILNYLRCVIQVAYH